MDGRPWSPHTGPSVSPSGRAASPETALQRLHQVRQGTASTLQTDTGVLGGDAARYAEDNEKRVRAEYEQAVARV